MSGRSGAISHTTLHEATKGNRLPSWGTTVEFAKACGADPAELRERWERANLAVRAASAGRPAAVAPETLAPEAPGAAAVAPEGPVSEGFVSEGAVPEGAVPEGAVPEGAAGGPRDGSVAVEPRGPRADEEAPASGPVPSPNGSAGGLRPLFPAPKRRRRSRPTVTAAVALVAAAIGTWAVVLIVADRGRGGPEDYGAGAKTALSPADCPVEATNPAPAPPRHKGDAAKFVADITLPDCTHVGTGQNITKVWRLKNTGTVPWEGYSLRRLDVPQRADHCQTISDVPIADTAPGEEVDIRTEITTPRKSGLCYVRFKMVDGEGKVAFPGSRPVNFQVIVEGPYPPP
ncbi:hypothetical protein GWI34_08755 [Actinomadura sp. DSM 109109]|nr:hypothetical protein [Actinomadura lepetitiana]